MIRLLVPLLLLLSAQAVAEAPPIKITPLNFQLEADEGDQLAQTLTLVNSSREPVPVKIEAVNWSLDAEGRRLYNPPEARLDDCRSWWPAGFIDLLIQPGSSIGQSIDIRVPAELEDEFECRFALAVYQVHSTGLGVPVYVPVVIAAEGAEPDIEFERVLLGQDDQGKKPMVMIRNEGTAHARVYGMLQGDDGQGQELDLIVRPTEILPGESRGARLLIGRRGGGEVYWSPPVTVEGKLIYGEEDISVEGVLR